MESVNVDDETNDLLLTKGLKCVCQLCDCGRFHKHPGCKVPFPTVATTFDEGKIPKLQSDYQARFPAYNSQPAQPIYHEEEIKKPYPPQQMDLNTTKQMSYRKFENTEVRKPCKLRGEISEFMSGEFNDKTNYKDSYVGYTAKPTKTARPSTVFKGNDGNPFTSESEYTNIFQRKEKVPQEKFVEKPVHTYDLLYPDYVNLPKSSVKNSVYDGRQCEKVKPCDMRKPNIDFGLHGEFDHTTTNGVHFKDFDAPLRTRYSRRSDQRLQTCKFNAISQNQADFQYDEKEATIARGKKITEHPSLIQLSMDIPHDFKTVSSLSYYNWKPEDFRRPIGDNKPTSKYTPSAVKFDHDSHTHHDYVSYGVTPRTEIYHPPDFRKSSAKVSGESMYRAAFQDHGKPERKFYGEYHSPNLQLPPPNHKFDASSTMRFDYKPIKMEKRKPFKPTYKANTTEEKFPTATEYNETFLPQPNKPCKFSKYMAEQEAARRSTTSEVTVT